ncbi:uncharacterized protein [Parasteatoda tepidariorum]|uniref:uncharacterized protein n=1 Tax=Parasteatoda tepidariorum TaxID=114398 RepID=UPI0039BD0E55
MNCYETLYHTLSSYSITHPNFNCNEFDASLWRLEISDPMPIAEGVPLLIACIVVNDSSVNVVWLKDGYPINFKLTSGRVWNLTIPRDSYGRETYLLGFDRTHSLDTGTITCTSKTEKKDESLSVYITIKPLTKPLVTPLALTVRKGNSANITCVSKDDIEGDFLYTWRKNDSEISSRYDSEKAEDLFPVGTRIILRNVSASANYSCIVRSPTGSVRSSSTVTVVESKDFSSKTCKQNKSHGIRWKTTAAGMIDIHMCPNGYEGQVSRKCIVCSTRKVIWDKPDFSQCLSNELLEIKKEFDRRRMGFQSKSIHTVLMSLLHFLNTKSRDMRSSEGEPIVNILCSADFNMFFTDNFETNWHMLLEIFSLLFTNSLVLHTYERMKLMSAIQNITMLFADATQDQIWKIQNFENECLGINILKVSNNSFNLMEVPLQFHNQSESGMLQNVKLELLTKKNFTDIPASTVAFIVYKCLNLIEYEELIIRDKFMENSTVMTVFMSSAHFSEVKIRINFAHYYNINKIKNNISCWKLSLNERFLLKNECHIQEQRENYTICHCIGPGTFIIIQDYKTQEDHTELVYNDLTSLLCVGCFLAICIILHLFVKTLSSIKNKMQLLLA